MYYSLNKHSSKQTSTLNEGNTIKETEVTSLLTDLYIHVAALPWKDEGFTRNVATKMAAADQIIQHTAKEIMKLGETYDPKNSTKEAESQE